MIRLEQNALKGSFPPLVTPFKDDGSVDYDTYAKLVEFHVKGGSAGIVVTGTTGEPSTLTAGRTHGAAEGRDRGRAASASRWWPRRARRTMPIRW